MKLKVGATVRVEVSKKKTWMSHFPTGFDALLGLNYRQKYGNGSSKSWIVFHPTLGSICWYDSDDLTVLIPSTIKSELKARRLGDRS